MKIKDLVKQVQRNPVHKNLNKFNKPSKHKDKKNDYERVPKHRKTNYAE